MAWRQYNAFVLNPKKGEGMFRGISIVLGVLMIIGGLYCLFAPGATYLALAPIIAVLMIVFAIGDIIMWIKGRRMGIKNPWLLISGILSAILGVVMLGSAGMQFAFDVMIAYMVAAWTVLSGAMNIGTAIDLRKLKNCGIETGASWILILIFGILMILAGIAGFFNPAFVMLAVGIMLGISVISTGASLVSLAFI